MAADDRPGVAHTAEKDAHGWTCDGCLMLAMIDRAERAEAALVAHGIPLPPRVLPAGKTQTDG